MGCKKKNVLKEVLVFVTTNSSLLLFIIIFGYDNQVTEFRDWLLNMNESGHWFECSVTKLKLGLNSHGHWIRAQDAKFVCHQFCRHLTKINLDNSRLATR